jgi:bicarbonate transport system substrate-binding protein
MPESNNDFSRRRFIATAGAAALSSVLLKGCLGNPPEDTPTINSAKAAKISIPPEQVPEITKVRLGYLPIIEAAPLIIAKEKGFFDKYGMTDVDISKQANWGAARDNVKIGSSAGGIDGGQWQMPMPYLISEGIITDNLKIPMYVLLQLNTQGNAIAISDKHKDKGLTLKADKAKALFDKMKSDGTRFKAAYTFPKSNQEFWIRYWLAANGVDPLNC